MISSLKTQIKGYLLKRWHIPFSPIPDIPASVYGHFRTDKKIALVDIGAHKGVFTKALKKAWLITPCVMIEPVPKLAADLRFDPAFKDFTIFNCAVSDINGCGTLNVFPQAPDMSSLLSLNPQSSDALQLAVTEPQVVKTQIRQLDDLLDEAKLGSISLIKIDVQGAEAAVCRGATKTLKRTNAVFVEVSFEHLYVDSTRFDELYDLMRSADFKMTSVEPGFRSPKHGLLQADVLFSR